jgi:serine protease Do
MNSNTCSLATASLAALLTIAFVSPPPLRAQEDVSALEEQAMKAAVSAAAPSVVRIETFGGLERVGQLLVGTGPTTGLVVDEGGYIISSAFNFVQMPTSILVTLPGGKRLAAQIVARDHSRMLVLLKVNSEEKLAVPQAVPRGEMIVGQWTIALGRTFEQAQPNISVGVLSATNRIWGKAIQTDAKVSPSNYGGPLVDIRGRVLGVLVPLSPQGQGEVAGAEWYDSGIGFAVPLDEVNRQLEKMKRGEDLHPGLLGVSLKGSDMYADPPEIAACPAKSPAAKAGLKPGDMIVEVDGVKIARQAQLKHEIGRRYAGEQVQVAVMRGDQRIEVTAELTDKIEPYEHAFLGILPVREIAPAKAGVLVRYVYPGSPAAEAGIAPNDRIVAVAGMGVNDTAAMLELMATYEPNNQVTLKVERDGQPRDVQLTLTKLPTEIPDALPAAHAVPAAEAGQRPPVGTIEIKIPEEQNECIAYVPDSYRGDVAHGVVLWLHAPGGFDKDKLVASWKDHCEKHDLILLAPKSADPSKWVPTEVDFIRKTLDDLLANYNVDRTRIVVHGHQGGAAMAYLVAFAHRDVIRGLAAVDAALPSRVRPLDNDPIQRLAFYTTVADKSPLAAAVKAGAKRLTDMKYPVTVKSLGEQPRYLNDEELSELVRWIDTLDRI